MSRMQDVEEIIDQLKDRFHVGTDAGLASKLGVAASTVAAWRSRGSIPKRYLEAEPDAGTSPRSAAPRHWNEFERLALPIALLRLCKMFEGRIGSYPEFLEAQLEISGAFLSLHAIASRELVRMVDAKPGVSPDTAASLVAFDEFSGEPQQGED